MSPGRCRLAVMAGRGAVVAALAACAGCGRGDEDPLVLSVGGAPAELAVWEDVAGEFSRETGVPVVLHRQPADTSQRRHGLIIALEAEQPDPDVFLMDVAWISLFAAAGWLEPLSSVDRGAFLEAVVDSVDVDEGRLIAAPVYVDAGVLYYRTDLAGPPRTQQELVETAKRVEAAQRPGNPGFYGFVWEGAQYEGLVCSFLEFAGSEGGVARRGDRLVVDLPANRSALAYMRDLIRTGVSPPSTYTEMREEEARAWFQRGDALYERNWPYAWALHQSAESPVRGRVGVAPLPAPPSGGSVSTLGGWHVGISSRCDRKADAQRLVEWITSRHVQKEMVLRLGWNPGRRDLYGDPQVLARAPHLAELAGVFRHARPRPMVPWYPQLSRVLQRHLSAALAGAVAPDEALARAQVEIDALAARYGASGSAR